jgi:hypothetical protein
MAVAYALVGTFLGFGMASVIPAMNGMGVAYYAMTWPLWISAGTYGTPAPPIPNWCFTFRAQEAKGQETQP